MFMGDLLEWASEGFAEVCGRRLSFTEAGRPSPLPSLVFIHGAGGSRSSWLLLLHDLSRRGLHVVALELPGHGASPGPGCRTIGEYAGFVEAFIAERGVTLLSAGLDEVPAVYKDIHEVMAAQADLVEPLATFQPKLVRMAKAGERPED